MQTITPKCHTIVRSAVLVYETFVNILGYFLEEAMVPRRALRSMLGHDAFPVAFVTLDLWFQTRANVMGKTMVSLALWIQVDGS